MIGTQRRIISGTTALITIMERSGGTGRKHVLGDDSSRHIVERALALSSVYSMHCYLFGVNNQMHVHMKLCRRIQEKKTCK